MIVGSFMPDNGQVAVLYFLTTMIAQMVALKPVNYCQWLLNSKSKLDARFFQDLEASDEITLMEIIKQLFPESMDLLGQYIAIGCQGVCKSNAMLDSIVGGLLTNGIIKQLGEQEKDARIEFMMFDPFEEVAWVKPIQQQYRKKVKVRRDQD
eukprot:TRINITY_DN24067_c0_g2_i3.p4 TRINITY_DN24067_c0_g2~~TRINITY_DN24067_c0_g2_i3.p4  ORF type:complete len:152 (-),score=22.15 TRINITY_DN24067_c0_g2_i3:482-937(-)